MRSTEPTRDPVVWAAATARSEGAPDAFLPCPGCGTRLKGRNLASHVDKVHPVAPGRSGTPLVGVDRRIHRTYGALTGLGLLAVGGLLVAFPDRSLPNDTELADAPAAIGRSPALVAVVVVLGAMAVVAVVHRVRPPRARLTVEGDAVVLRHRLGTGRVRARSRTVETGSLVRRVPVGTTGTAGSESSFPTDDEHAGTYLRVGRGRRTVTVGCASSTRARKHWTGWEPGPTRRWWDVTLSPADFVALQYLLADAGLLGVPPTRADDR